MDMKHPLEKLRGLGAPVPPPPPEPIHAEPAASDQPTCGSSLWNGLVVVADAIGETIAKVIAFVLGGVVFYVILPPMAPPLFAVAAATACSRLVAKVINYSNVESFSKLQRSANDVVDAYPKIYVITLIFAVVISPLSQILGIAIGSLWGLLNGVVMEEKLLELEQRVKREQYEEGRRELVNSTVLV